MTDLIPSFGTRKDPHAQTRAARREPLMLHSMALFREIFEVVYAHRKIATVVEVGVESGQVSSLYLDLGATAVHCVDPSVTPELRETLAASEALHLVEKSSPGVLAELPVADLYVLDGDHNYAVVHAELTWIMQNAPDAVVAFHDVLWPCSRRDLYYEPSPLGAEDRHPASAEDGPTVWHDAVSPAGLVGLGAFSMARDAGGERNGVLTAIEDALDQHDDEWSFAIVPAVFGVGVAVRTATPGAEELMAGLRPFTGSALLAALENNRIALYTRVLQMQYEAVAHAEHADRMAETMTAQRHEIDRLGAKIDDIRKRLGAEVAGLRRENERLRQGALGMIRAGVLRFGRAGIARARTRRRR
jgi:hypothetical protein